MFGNLMKSICTMLTYYIFVNGLYSKIVVVTSLTPLHLIVDLYGQFSLTIFMQLVDHDQ